MTRRTWRVPLRGGSASSMRSLKMTRPTLSLLVIAEKAKQRAQLGGQRRS